MKRVLLLALGVVSAGCAHEAELSPASGLLAVGADAATVTNHGVAVEVRGDAWNGTPSNLEDHVTPALVTLTNGGERPLMVRYQDIALVATHDRRFAALPPLRIEKRAAPIVDDSGRATVVRPQGFMLAPDYVPFFRGLPTWKGPFDFDPTYYSQHDDSWGAELPTPAMLDRALPEGVLPAGERISGFVYFERVGADVGRVAFRMQLVDARTRTPFGTVTIPLVVEDDFSLTLR